MSPIKFPVELAALAAVDFAVVCVFLDGEP